ncbi:PREDICTED: unconventional prefoldin RPB5 interactor-like [Priapulus caudatus]|uniref:Unconventional prefoldin RPB5 interactor-like n=1 Tax=Priapulus caudatus TaxID=37621 RepID=A0ABM1EW48_PRICU|nr:PREDICTED: unconventional prefoldin RPB5 interactor-like [Priapulus caudatus]XP_014676419.1 PREDICTED: unconventional prefoldin RPB5 interactor-like [Priapulus caudatus]
MDRKIMDIEHITRLKQLEEKELADCEAKLKQWEKYIADYRDLQKSMEIYPGEVSHDIMVPFGKLAFMPGKLVHTNEIMVLLGDNWFAERSAKQTIEIAQRRIDHLESHSRKLLEEKHQLESRLSFTEEFRSIALQQGDTQEIVEEYDEEREKQWREEHKKKLMAYKKKLRDEREQTAIHETTEVTASSDLTHEDIMLRLDELEMAELAEKEMKRMEINDGQQSAEDIGDHNSYTSYDGDSDYSHDYDKDDETEEEEEEDEEDEEEGAEPHRIIIKHTPLTKESEHRPMTEFSKIRCPADIYLHSAPAMLKDPPTKSMLKKSRKGRVKDVISNQNKEHKKVCFNQGIKEHEEISLPREIADLIKPKEVSIESKNPGQHTTTPQSMDGRGPTAVRQQVRETPAVRSVVRDRLDAPADSSKLKTIPKEADAGRPPSKFRANRLGLRTELPPDRRDEGGSGQGVGFSPFVDVTQTSDRENRDVQPAKRMSKFKAQRLREQQS